MLSGAKSSAAALVRPRTAHLLVVYAAICAMPRNPAVDDTLTMTPPPAALICGVTARIPKKGPVTLIAMIRFQSSVAVS